jgi:hypothetical protein
MSLNPQRPSNPFGQSEDQDWVDIPRSNSKTSLSSMSSSPYEKVNLPLRMQSSSASPAVARKLPPAYNPEALPARVGRMNLLDDSNPRAQNDGTDTPPPPPPPRRQTAGVGGRPSQPPTNMSLERTQTQPSRPASSASTTSLQQRSKPSAPPIARKPAHLTGGSSQMQSPILMQDRDRADEKPPLPSRTSTMGSQTGAVKLPGMDGGPALPSRKPVATPARQQQQQPPGDLLDSLDEDGRGVGGWETLQPSRM